MRPRRPADRNDRFRCETPRANVYRYMSEGTHDIIDDRREAHMRSLPKANHHDIESGIEQRRNYESKGSLRIALPEPAVYKEDSSRAVGFRAREDVQTLLGRAAVCNIEL